jgi:hypothetical protein
LVFRIKRFFDANAALVGVATGLFLLLVVLLSVRLRRPEMETLFRLGLRPWADCEVGGDGAICDRRGELRAWPLIGAQATIIPRSPMVRSWTICCFMVAVLGCRPEGEQAPAPKPHRLPDLRHKLSVVLHR